jgi:hypothetical protein
MIVWSCDDKEHEFIGRVVRTGERSGELMLIRIATGEVLRQERVSLAYGAVFGPDIADANDWLRKIYTWVKERDGKEKEPA